MLTNGGFAGDYIQCMSWKLSSSLQYEIDKKNKTKNNPKIGTAAWLSLNVKVIQPVIISSMYYLNDK